MYKIALIALGFAAASANFLSEDLRILQSNGVVMQNVTTTCARSGESCSTLGSGFCCSVVTRNGTNIFGATNTTSGVCAPAEFHGQQFINVNGNTNYTFACSNTTTSTALLTTQTTCSDATPCANTTTHCCAPRQWTLGGVSGNATARSACLPRESSGNRFWANVTAQSINSVALVSAQCPALVDTTTSFGAYMKASAMLVVALVAAMFF